MDDKMEGMKHDEHNHEKGIEDDEIASWKKKLMDFLEVKLNRVKQEKKQ